MNESGPFGQPELSDATLLQQIRDKQQSAEQTLVMRYWRGLYFILNRRSQDPDLAADIAQDTFIVVINKARNGEVENPLALAAFIRQVGVNLLIAHYRKTTRRDTHNTSDFNIQVPDNSPNLYRMLYSQNAVKLVRQLIDEMNVSRDREILINFFIYEKDKVEICAALSITADNFDKVLHRARGRLKQLIAYKCGGAFADTVSFESLLLILAFSSAIYAASQSQSQIETQAGRSSLGGQNHKNILSLMEGLKPSPHLIQQVVGNNSFVPLQGQYIRRGDS